MEAVWQYPLTAAHMHRRHKVLLHQKQMSEETVGLLVGWHHILRLEKGGRLRVK